MPKNKRTVFHCVKGQHDWKDTTCFHCGEKQDVGYALYLVRLLIEHCEKATYHLSHSPKCDSQKVGGTCDCGILDWKVAYYELCKEMGKWK